MNTKLSRILDEIKRTEEKIAAWQEHLEELNIRKKQLEDAEIIKSIRSMKLEGREMLLFLENIRNGTLAVPVRQGEPEAMEQKEVVLCQEKEQVKRELFCITYVILSCLLLQISHFFHITLFIFIW